MRTLEAFHSHCRHSTSDAKLSTIRQQLHQELLRFDLLQEMHFQQVKALRPGISQRRSHKGRHRHGGVDIEALVYTPLSRMVVAVQVKQYQRPVARHFVDALRGALLRRKAQQGLLITTSNFAPTARRAAAEDRLLPITLLDGERLLDLLFHYQLGVRFLPYKTAKRNRNLWKLDRECFLQLRTCRDGSAPNSVPTSPLHKSEPPLIPPSRPHRLNNLNPQKGGGMQGRTHVLLGINSLWLLYPIPLAITPDTLLPLVLGTALGSLLPDLDAAESKIKYLEVAGIRPFMPLSSRLHHALGHRGLLHSISGWALCVVPALLVGTWWSWWLALALLLGYGSHLAGDACTKSGIPFFYVPHLHPSKKRCHLLPRPLRLTTGSLAEEAVCALLALSVLLLLLNQLAISSLTYQL